jgi:hypothetical protein
VNGDDAQLHLFHYVVAHEDVTMQVTIFGIDITKLCGTLSNIDLVYFMWDNFLRFSYKKYAMALSPRGSAQPELLFLKHYRVESEAWKDSARCEVCVEHHQKVLLPFLACDLSDDCKCKICTRHPPSLADSARHVLFNYTLHLDRFKLAVDTTHNGYVYAARSNRVPQANLLPPEAPLISMWFCYDIDSTFRFHRVCQGAGPWRTQSERAYDSTEEMIEGLITHKNHFWCHHCERGLFYPLSCTEHADTDEADNEEDEDIVM